MFLSNLVVKEKTCLLVNPDEFETDPRKPFHPSTVSHFSPGSFGFLVRAYVMGKLKKTSVRISFGTAMLSLKQKHSGLVWKPNSPPGSP